MAKRLFDCLASTVGLFFLAPLLIVLALLIRLDSRGPIFFRQQRVGLGGKLFRIHKFRTMVIDAELQGSQITVRGDPRITRMGHWLRSTKLDELPQLFDVVIGHMSLVGPRPEVPYYVQLYPPDVRLEILSVRPGITDPASIHFRNEGAILGRASDPHLAYLHDILPVKCRYYIEYIRGRSFFGDMVIVFKTFGSLIWPFSKWA